MRDLGNHCLFADVILYLISLQSEITRNEMFIEEYRPYLGFLQRVLPMGRTIGYCLKSPHLLIESLNNFKNRNLVLVHLEELLERVVDLNVTEIVGILEDEKHVIDKITPIEFNDAFTCLR